VTLNDAALVVGANAIATAISHLQAHSAAPTAGVGSEMGSRIAAGGEAVDADGDITWTNVAFTGLTASTTFWGVSYWSASSGGTNYGQQARSGGDTTTNSAGEYTWTGAENSTAT
jgi:hypothetical protein